MIGITETEQNQTQNEGKDFMFCKLQMENRIVTTSS